MNVNDVHKGIQKNKRLKRVGRGIGSGHGKTAGRGHKGQRSRSGFKQLPIFQGGGSPLVRRIPKRGFHNEFADSVAAINVGNLNEVFADGEEVNPETLKAKSVLRNRYDLLKILGDGELTKKLKVSAHKFSAGAKTKIEQAGGEVIVLPPRTPVREKQDRKKAERKAQQAQA